MSQLCMHSPIGDLTVTDEDGAIISLDWGWVPQEWQAETPLLREAINQLDDYFDGKRVDFDLPLNPPGSDYQKKVCFAMKAIPGGTTRSYGEIAKDLESSAQAVGNACGLNPIPIIIPCHRVLAAGKQMGGFSGDGGVDTKKILLELENALPPIQQQLDL